MFGLGCIWIKVWPVAGSSDHSYENAGSVEREKWLDFLVNTNL